MTERTGYGLAMELKDIYRGMSLLPVGISFKIV